MTELVKNEETIDKIMEQVHAYARAWATLGSSYDRGFALGEVSIAEAHLRDTIIAALSHEGMGFDLVAHLDRQMTFSARTFGPDPRQPGVCDHIRRELVEVENAPTPEERLKEWIDVILLGLDGAWRSQIETGLPKSWVISLIVEALEKKQTRNENRTWPDWRTMPTDKAIEHLPSLINEGGRE